MASIYDKASLVLIPSGTKTSKVYSQVPVSGDGDFTFSRFTMATRVNADGNIEKETQNLLLQSNSFDTTWLLQTSALTSGQAGYDGTNNAWLLERQTTGSAAVYQSISVSGVHTFSVYAKAGTADGIRIRIDQTTDANLYVNLTDGSIINQLSNISTNVTSVGNGWYRVEMAYLASGMINAQIRVVDNGGAAALGTIYIQDAQLEQGLVARDYIETTTSAVEGGITDNVPRLDYTDSSCPALLLEPQRTNVLLNSEYGFGNTNSIITYNNITSPEGLQNAFKLTENTASGGHRADANFNADADTYTFSVFAKAGERNYINFAGSNVGAFSSTFNLSTGVLEGINGGIGSIEDYGNGWYRLIVTKTISSAGGVAVRIGTATSSATQALGSTQNYTGDGTSGLYLYGYMVERGSYATSYIPTYGTSVTRDSESCIITSGLNVIGQEQGTMYWDINFIDNGGYPAIFLYDGTTNNRLLIQRRGNNNVMQTQIRSGNSLQADYLTSSAISNGNHKMAVAYATNDFQSYLDGASAGSDSSGTTYTNELTQVSLKPNEASIRINQVLVFKTRLSNEELADLTTL